MARGGNGRGGRAADQLQPGARLRLPRPGPCKLPTVREYARLPGVPRARWPRVTVISAWNEANHRSQPTFKEPQASGAVLQRGAGQLPALQDHRRRRDRRDQHGALCGSSSATPKRRRSGASTATATPTRAPVKFGGTAPALLRAVEGGAPRRTGGIVKFELPVAGRCSVRRGARQPGDQAHVRARQALPPSYQRLYIYQWQQPAGVNRFDAGLIAADGAPRPPTSLCSALQTRTFNP